LPNRVDYYSRCATTTVWLAIGKEQAQVPGVARGIKRKTHGRNQPSALHQSG